MSPAPPVQSALRRPDGHLVVAAWLVALVALDPRGAFPLSDDWSYAIAASRLVEGGGFHPTGWTSIPLLSHLAWGALFSPGGVSFESLRLGTVAAGVVGGYGVYVLLDDLGATRPVAAVTQATFLFCPLTVGLAVTFMTDLPYAALEVWAAVLLLRHLRSGADGALWAGAAVALAATLSRQTGLAVPLAFGLALLARRGPSVQTAWRALFPLATSVAGLVAVQAWLAAAGRMPAIYPGRAGSAARHALSVMGVSQVVGNAHSALITLGLVLAPVLVVVGAAVWRRDRRPTPWLLAGAVVVALGVARLLTDGAWRLPLIGNTLVEAGIGPLTLFDADVLGVANVPGLPGAFWGAATVVGALGATALLVVLGAHVARAVRDARALGDAEAAGGFLLLASAATLAPLLPGTFFDRYLIVVLPLVAGALVALVRPRRVSRRVLAVAALAVAALGAYGVAGTHDYLAWNRARWALLDRIAREDPAAWARIDGGFEFNGLVGYDPDEPWRPGRSRWSRGNDEVVAFGPIPGYDVVGQEAYRRWLLPGAGRVVWLRRWGARRTGAVAP